MARTARYIRRRGGVTGPEDQRGFRILKGDGILSDEMQIPEFVRSHAPLPSIEVDVDSVDLDGPDLADILSDALTGCVAKDPDLKATVYFYFSSSINFGEMTSSEFITVAGPAYVFDTFLAALRSIHGIRFRKSDMLKPEDHLAALHVEHGRIWVPADAISWTALAQERGSEVDA